MRWHVWLGPLILVSAATVVADEIRVENVGLTLIDKADVAAREAGAISEVCVNEGDLVQAGQRLVQLEDQAAQLQLARAKIDAEEAQHRAENDVPLRLAKTSLELAELNLRRAHDSLERFPKSVSAAELDQLRLAVEKARLDIDQAQRDNVSAQRLAKAAQNDVELALVMLQRRAVAAPLEGIVSEIKCRPGEWLTPGEKVVRVVNVSKLRAEGFVASEQLTSELLNRPVVLSVNNRGSNASEFPGRVTFVSSEANPVNGSVRISAEIENRELRLRPGQSGTLVISTAATPPLVAP